MLTFKNILYVVEGDGWQPDAYEQAWRLAEACQASLTVLDVLAPAPQGLWGLLGLSSSEALDVQRLERRYAELTQLTATHAMSGAVHIQVLCGRPPLEAIRQVLRAGHDLVIKPMGRVAALDRVLGGHDMQLLRKCPCPVWLMARDAPARLSCVLCAVDVDQEGRLMEATEAFNLDIGVCAAGFAQQHGAALHLAHFWDAPGESLIRTWSDHPDEVSLRYVEAEASRHHGAMGLLREALTARLGADSARALSPEFHVRRGMADSGIPALANELKADLVVMGTVGRTGVAGLVVGNTAETILEQLQCSILALKPPGFVSPVSL